jgi:hypothetical protein
MNEPFKLAVQFLKKTMSILAAFDAKMAAAAINLKLIDCLDAICDNNNAQATNDIWMSSFVVQRVVYQSISELLKKTSTKAEEAEALAAANGWESGAKKYMDASAEISVGVGYSVLFNDGGGDE